MKTTKIFQSLPLGKLLSSIEGTNIHQVLKSYIVDFVHMVHPVQSDAECDVSNTINPVIGWVIGVHQNIQKMFDSMMTYSLSRIGVGGGEGGRQDRYNKLTIETPQHWVLVWKFKYLRLVSRWKYLDVALGLRSEDGDLNNLVKQTPSFIRHKGLSVKSQVGRDLFIYM